MDARVDREGPDAGTSLAERDPVPAPEAVFRTQRDQFFMNGARRTTRTMTSCGIVVQLAVLALLASAGYPTWRIVGLVCVYAGFVLGHHIVITRTRTQSRVEPDLGTPARGGLPATIARRGPDGWRVSGRKIYSTGAPALAYGLVWARTDEAVPRIGFFLVPMASAGVRIEETWDQLGLRASGSHDVVLDEVAIPHDHAVELREPGAWGGPEAETLAWNTTLIGSLYDGVARAAQAWLVRFLTERAPANLGAPLASLPRFQDAVGEGERLLATNRRLLRGAALDTDAGTPPSAVESGLTKLTVTENAILVVQRAVELTGNPGLSRGNPLERHLRDVLCARIHTPQGDTIRLAAGRAALGL